VLGIGASAGGLDAFKLLLRHLPVDTGFALVLVQHLDPTHPSMLTEILGRVTRMPVVEAADAMAVEPNHVYVIPPNAELRIVHRELKVTQRRDAGQHLPIDVFLRSLADACGSSGIGVILSGTGTDGSAGLQAVKEAGGVTFAQDPHTAEYPHMPVMAASATNVDFVLSPEAIAAEVARIARHPFFALTGEPELEHAPENQFGRVLAVMLDATGIDFSLYREKTVHRRILRRVALRNTGTLEEYTRLLEGDRTERNTLQRDLLISVTSFFRDPAAFEALKKAVFPQIVENRPAGATIRIWAAGCATGEEAYSIAIALQEYLSNTANAFPVQIFASDISDAGIEKARAGKYPDTIAANVSTERLDRFFTRVDGGYQVCKSIREMCIFSRHNLMNDPAFSKLDIITCRNVLIYLGSVQKNIISLFHYALKSNGFLMLGASEAPSDDDLFSVADEEDRLYSKKRSKRERYSLGVQTWSNRGAQEGEKAEWKPGSQVWDGADVAKEVDRLLLSRYSPSGVVVDEDLDVIEMRGPATPYLQLPSGKLSFRLLTLVPDTGFYLELEKLIQTVKTSGKPSRNTCVHYEHSG
jgi:two-component system CheB/CheR fusion protein